MASLLRRGAPPQNQRLTVVSGLVMTALGVVAISAAALAGGDDDDDAGDQVVAGRQTTSSEVRVDKSGGEGDDEGGGTGGTSEPADDEPGAGELPDCFDQFLAEEPVVAEENHILLDEGVNRQVVVNMHAADAIALELVEDDELLGVMRVGDQALPVSDALHIYDVVDPSCQHLPFTPQDTDDEVADTHRTVVPLDLAGRRYEVTFVQHGIQTELDVVLRRVG
jgi:hypothetical protein